MASFAVEKHSDILLPAVVVLAVEQLRDFEFDGMPSGGAHVLRC